MNEEKENKKRAKSAERKRVIPLPPPEQRDIKSSRYASLLANKNSALSIAELRAIFNDGEVLYSDEELYRIDNWMDAIVSVVLDIAIRSDLSAFFASADAPETDAALPKRRITLPSTDISDITDSNDQPKSNPLHPRIHRRTG